MFGLMGCSGMEWNEMVYNKIPLFGLMGCTWNGMECNGTNSILYHSILQFLIPPNLGGIQWNEICVLKFYYSTLLLFASSSTQSQFSTRSFLYFYWLHFTFIFFVLLTAILLLLSSHFYDFASQGTSFLPHLFFHRMLLCMFSYVYQILFVTWSFHFYYVYHNINPLWAIYFVN